MTTYRIDRSKWVCGGKRYANLGDPAMLNSEGRMCCLGQMCRQAGVSDWCLREVAYPSSVAGDAKVPRWMLQDGQTDSNYSKIMAKINDDKELTPPERERRLKAACPDDVRLVFYGKLGGIRTKSQHKTGE